MGGRVDARVRAPSASTRRRIRLMAWAGMAVLVAARIIIALAGLAPTTELLLADGLTYLVPMLLVAVSSGFLALRLRTGVEHRFWASVLIATCCLMISESYWTWYAVNVDFRGPPLPSPMTIFGVLAALFYGAIIVSMTRFGQRTLAVRVRLLLDVSAAMTIAYAAVYLVWTLPSFAGLENAIVAAAWAAAWPVFGATILGAILIIMAGFKTYLWRPWERLVALANAVFAVGLISFPVWYPALMTTDALKVGWYGLILGCGLYLLFVAAVYRATASEEEALEHTWPTPAWRFRWAERFYPVVATIGLLVIAWAAYYYGGSGIEGPLLGSSIVLAALLAGRSWLATLEVGHYRLTAVTDPLTGAYNSSYFQEQLQHRIGRDSGSDRLLGLVLIDIDDFGRIERIHGRSVGDRLLTSCASAIKSTCGPQAEVFRMRADEFAALLPGMGASESLNQAKRVVHRIASQGEGTEVDCSVSVGVASYPEHALEPESLVACARVALEQARSEDGGPIRMFDPSAVGRQRRTDTPSVKELRDSLRSLAAAVDARDPVTRHHSLRVAELSRRLAQAAGLPEARLRLCEHAALVHDIGKVGVNEQFLRTPGRLSAEQAAVDEHAEIGEAIVAACGFPEIASIVRHHHERWDGAGLPDGLAGDRIPVESRILAICNSFVALTAGGLAPTPATASQALVSITEGAGSLFDPTISATFAEMMAATPRALQSADPGFGPGFGGGSSPSNPVTRYTP